MLPFFPLNHPCQNIHLKRKQRIIHRDLSGDGITEQLREMERARIEGVVKDEVELVKEIAILENIYFRRNEDMLLDVLYEVH